MKLIDILARELKEWPEGVSGIEQDRRGSCLYQYTGPAISAYVESVADDADTAVVTRGEWLAAVNALKAASAPAWVGIGKPPVGTVCEVWHDSPHSAWAHHVGKSVLVISHDGPRVVYRAEGLSGAEYYGLGGGADGNSWPFRPIRTPEQIAADERNREVELAVQMIIQKPFCHNSIAVQNGIRHAVGEMIRAGYRKQATND